MSATVVICGIPIDDVDMNEALEIIWELIRSGRDESTCHQVATVNVDFVVNALEEPAFAENLRATSLSTADGMPLVWGARLVGGRLRTRVAGADLVPAIARKAAADSTSIAFYGAAPGVAERAAEQLTAELPGLRAIGLSGPSFGSVDDLSIDDLDDLASIDADIVCLAFGSPKQEFFIERFGSELNFPVMIGVGATFDFLVGEKRRAPLWMQRTGTEWIHRTLTEPRRLARRYWRDARVFLPALLKQAWIERCGKRESQVVTATRGRSWLSMASQHKDDGAAEPDVAS